MKVNAGKDEVYMEVSNAVAKRSIQITPLFATCNDVSRNKMRAEIAM